MPKFRNSLPLLAVCALLAACATPQPSPPTGPLPPTNNYSYRKAPTNQMVVALTFDDGPSAATTPRLLEILKKKDVRATFFVVGKNVATYPDIVRQAVANGHEIGNHSWNHPKLPLLTDAGVTAELQRTDDALTALGVKVRYLRPPYGSITDAQRQWIHKKFGYHFILWDVDPGDWQRPVVGEVVSRVVNNARPGSIILLHDIHPDTVTAVPEIIDQLRARGFNFLTVSELLATP